MLRVGSSDLRIPVTLSYDGVGRLISTFNTKGFLLEFKGTIMVDYITLPLEFSYSV
jgi:YD repeat-containing protein